MLWLVIVAAVLIAITWPVVVLLKASIWIAVLVTVLLVLLVVGGSATLVFSATDLPGAKETRNQVFALASAGKRQIDQWFPSGESPPPAPAQPASVTAPGGASARPARHCPDGMRAVVVGPSGNDEDESGAADAEPSRQAGEGGGGARDGGASGVRVPAICVDEQPVREVDYAACAKCQRPRLAHHPLDASLPPPSRFCLDGQSPTDQSLTCVTSSQARAFCETRKARLPTQAELDQFVEATRRPSPTPLAPEWTASAARSKPGEYRAFRCVLGDE